MMMKFMKSWLENIMGSKVMNKTYHLLVQNI